MILLQRRPETHQFYPAGCNLSCYKLQLQLLPALIINFPLILFEVKQNPPKTIQILSLNLNVMLLRAEPNTTKFDDSTTG